MDLDPDACYQAFLAKDARFDGQVLIGVTSTGVYCRPICRVRAPKREHCLFFKSAAMAEAARLRPCLKCRPEIAPENLTGRWTVMDASRTLAEQAAALLDSQLAQAEHSKISALAQRLGITDRHLRRIFPALWGVTPHQYLQTRRLHLAKALLTDSRLPIAQVALASGFSSIRRFNATFAENYRLSPSHLRGQARTSQPLRDSAITLKLSYRTPFDLSSMGAFLAQRAIPMVESVETQDDGSLRIRRSLRGAALLTNQEHNPGHLAPEPGWIEIVFDTRRSQVSLSFPSHWVHHTASLIRMVRRWLDLDASPEVIDSALHDLPGAPGIRLPGSLDAFELSVRAILGQQVSVKAARTLSTRLVEQLGSTLASPWSDINRVFVEPEVLAAQTTQDLVKLGLTATRAQTLIELAKQWPRLQKILHETLLGRQTIEQLLSTLCELPGVGPWTAQYIAMRALSWPDASLPGDLALRRAMKQLFNTTTARMVESRALAWRPWRSYAAIRLWNTETK